jgi:Uma2 family endonuclease
VEEYCMVDPSEKVIWQYFLENGRFVNYQPIIEDDSIGSRVLEGFEMELKEVFKEN